MRANAAGGNSTSAATGAGNPGEEAAAELARMKQLAGTPTAADQDDADMGAAMKANAQAAKEKEYAAGADQADADMGAAMTANAAQSAALASGAQDDATGVDKAVAANAAAPAAPTQAASPAAPAPAKAGFKADPIGQSIANQLKMTTPDAIKLFQKNNGLTADGQIGPATTKALQAAAKKMGVTTTSGVGTSTAGAGRGGQGGPTAAQLAAPRPGVNQPAAKPAPAKPLPGKTPFPGAGQISDNPAAEDRQYYEELDKMLTIAKLR
jgi:DnaK suppressor protein